MSEIAQQTTGLRSAATAVVHESYSFACMRCGHGWEQSYEIEHHIDGDGHEFVMYVANGEVVPSPLSRPTCQNCDGHVVRIMRPGQVSSVQNSLHRPHPIPRQADSSQQDAADGRQPDHHWHLSDLLHVFHRKAS
ncbi:hypothetical protein EJ357_19020 [Streptomyces cyaneochromogenes]|uniref:C2H2-type domain-containing protein n=1 Tax=Streptomyces cyaneochromogenes TaxID=2496836 RepID=A0A3Q9ET79_9ACTN|nr:hypothetical protein [Streptomyces cyaneochromogenes]AZQ35324.1 hypothetical protein EJ357_19020 [Streptomyces cyaneochromogenes]